MIKLRNLMAIASVLVMTACTQFALVEPQKPVKLADTYELDPQIAWSKLSSGPRESWTVDGPLLNQVRFYNGLIDGDSLREVRAKNTTPIPQFRKSMSPLEIRDFVVASFARDNHLDLTTSGLRPFDFGPDPGFRFEYRYATPDGLRKRGVVVGTVYEGRLFLIAYSAPEVYYFDRYLATVERMIGSLRAA